MNGDFSLSNLRLERLRLHAERDRQEAYLREQIEDLKRMDGMDPRDWGAADRLLSTVVIRFIIAQLELERLPILNTDPTESDDLLSDGPQ